MVSYKYKKTAGALQEAPQGVGTSMPPPRRTQAMISQEEVASEIAAPPAQSMAPQSVESMRQEFTPSMARTRIAHFAEHDKPAAPSRPAQGSLFGGSIANHEHLQQDRGMFFRIIHDGEQVLVGKRSGHTEIVKGPARVWRIGRTFRPLPQHVAHPGEFLIVRSRDGGQRHIAGPAEVWFDPREHTKIQKEEALPISSKEAVVVYAENDEGTVERRIVFGPATFIPQPGERLHTFSWHGSRNGQKVPNALEFQKLWMLPDQMYHDVSDVRTADDAVLTIRLMLFFQLEDIEKMLASTHDPIGDFLNAATSDIVDFVGRHTFESFKKHTEALNRIETYKQLTSRAQEIGYAIDRVVFRGYGAPASLQEMHDQAIESRTRLQLERATEEQAQQLEDQKLERELERSAKLREAQEEETQSTIRMKRLEADAERELEALNREFERKEGRLDAEARRAQRDASEAARLAHLRQLSDMGVDLTRYLTQGRADQVLELRGSANGAHVHLGENGLKP